MFWHITDPEAPRRAVPRLALMVEQRRISAANATTVLAAAPAPHADPSGWPARREWALRDACGDCARARRKIAWAIRDGLAPLLAARAGREALEGAALAADPRGLLTREERAALVRLDVARALGSRVQPGHIAQVQPRG